VLNHEATKKLASDAFACAATKATAVDMRTVVVVSAALAVVKEVRVVDTTAIVGLAQVDQIEALQNAVLVAEKDVPLAEIEVQQEVQLEALADALVDGNSKKVVLRKRSTNF
jgi:hypothetical protein